MRSLFIALISLLVVPTTALGAGLSAVARDVPLGRESTVAPRFNLVGLHWQGGGEVSFRAKAIGGGWGEWRDAAPEAEDAPDPGREGGRPGWRIGNPYWTGPSNRLQIRTRGRVRRIRAQYVWSPADRLPVRSISVADSPLILSRLAWGANERIRRGRPKYADALRFAIVHHTAGSNTYSRAQSASIVRGIQLYHVRSNGWDDIGYNFLVDKYGQVFEGRAGGVDRNVVGAHAAGFNNGSVGVALLGNYDAGAVTPNARTALTQLLAWRLDLGHLDPVSLTNWTSTGNPRFPTGAPVTLRAVSGHRDTGFTSCPGGRLYGELGNIGRMTSELGLPKLYSPRAVGAPGGMVRFTARLTEPLPWTVIVTDQGGTVVATGGGDGTAVDWVWDARTVPAGRYSYAIDAGPTVRPATGIVAGTTQRATLTALARPALITPNGDGRQETTTVQYRITAPATVTATVVDSAGAPLSLLFTEQKVAGSYTFRWDGAGVPDGRYGILLSARNDAGIEATATVTVIVNRTLAGVRIVPQVFSPNADGRLDTTKFRFGLNGPARVTVSVLRKGRTLGQVFAGPREGGPQAIDWNGRFAGRLGAGEYKLVVRATTAVSTVVQTVDFALDLAAPRLQLVSAPELRFAINEPGDVTVLLDGSRTVRARRLAPGRFAVPAGGPFTTIRAVARDFAGNETAPLLR
ncbi:MAG: N-acetylmuramoyl-L-alanine amidase [Actinobacteria bacterium]|nr:N-acetylmuramoyl-L-alanine amidase [Actinomycetota bacterium]